MIEGFAPGGRVSDEMKRPLSPFNMLRLGTLVLLLAVLNPIGMQAEEPVRPLALPGKLAEPPQPARFDFEFPGGSPAEFLKALSDAAGGGVNLLIPDGVEDLRLPKLKLSRVTVQDVFYGLSNVGSSFRGQPGAEWAYQFQPTGGIGQQNAVAPVWVLSVFRNQPAIKPTLKVFSLARYLGKPEQGLHSVDDIITAVQAGWKMQKSSPIPELTYHPETKLLMAYGQEAQLTLITDVLKQLELTAPAPVHKEKVNPEVMKTLEKGGLVMPEEPAKSK